MTCVYIYIYMQVCIHIYTQRKEKAGMTNPPSPLSKALTPFWPLWARRAASRPWASLTVGELVYNPYIYVYVYIYTYIYIYI